MPASLQSRSAVGLRALGPFGRPVGILALFFGVLASCVAGCAPALDWREVAAPSGGLRLLMPCKPVVAERSVRDPQGRTVSLTMQACDAAGLSFAVVTVVQERTQGVPEPTPAQVQEALQQLVASASAGLGAVVAADRSWPAPAAAPEGRLRPHLARAYVRGAEASSAVHTHALFLSDGLVGHQITVSATGRAPSDDVTESLFTGVRSNP